MIFRKAILSLTAYGFLFCAKSQQQSPGTISDTAFQKNPSFSKNQLLIQPKKKKIDSVMHGVTRIVAPFKKNEVGLSDNYLHSFNRKHLESLQEKIKTETSKYFKQPVVLVNAALEYSGLYDSSYWPGSNTYYQGNFSMNSEWMVAGIPVSFNLDNQVFADIENYSANNFDFRFDKDAYLNQVKKKLAGKLDPSSVINNIEDPLKSVKEQAEQLLKKDLSNLINNYNGLLDQDVAALTNNPAAVFSGDMKHLRQRFMSSELVQKVYQNEVLLSSLQQKANMGEKVNAEDITKLRASVQKLKGLQEMLLKIEEHKSKWESSGMVKKIKEFELLKKNKISQLINDPSFIRKKAKEHLSLKGVQKLFLNVNRLNIGRDALSLSPMSFQHFLHNGISTEFLNNKGKTFMLVAGKQKDINSVLDQGFTGNLASNNGQVKAARLGLLSTGMSTSHMSVSSFSQSMSSNMGLLNANEFRRILVTTISNQLSIGQKGFIEVDLSRSATAYQQNNNTGDSLLKPKNNLSGILSSENFMANTALSVRYADENAEKGLAYQFNFSKVANGYTNPGNSFLNGGSTELGTQLRKSFFKNRMQLSFRGNVRDYKYSDEIDSRWRNVYMVLDGKWRMKKGQHIGMRYQPNRMTRIEEGSKSIVTSIERLSVESNVYKKIGKTGYRNYLTLGWQKNIYALSATENVSNSSLQINSFQNITIGKNLFYANLSYTSSNNSSAFVYFNTSLNTDIGYTFQLFKKITASSGIVYASVNEWYRQLGIRQVLSGQLNEKFYINIYVDARKNLELVQPLWNSPVRADISIKYILKN